MMLPRRPSESGANQLIGTAFTLVETVLALGIVSFALVSILGMIPVGLSTFRDAVEVSAESAIVRQLSADLQQSETVRQEPLIVYFNEQGEKVAASDSLVAFSAEVSPPRALDSSGLAASADAHTVMIEIRKTIPPSTTKNYSLVILQED